MDYNGHTASIALFWFLWLLGFISFTRVIEKENVMNIENFFLIELKLETFVLIELASFFPTPSAFRIERQKAILLLNNHVILSRIKCEWVVWVVL